MNQSKVSAFATWVSSVDLLLCNSRSNTAGKEGFCLPGLFVQFACAGTGDPMRVLRLFHNKYTGYN